MKVIVMVEETMEERDQEESEGVAHTLGHRHRRCIKEPNDISEEREAERERDSSTVERFYVS